jgi:hypothetical protein
MFIRLARAEPPIGSAVSTRQLVAERHQVDGRAGYAGRASLRDVGVLLPVEIGMRSRRPRSPGSIRTTEDALLGLDGLGGGLSMLIGSPQVEAGRGGGETWTRP